MSTDSHANVDKGYGKGKLNRVYSMLEDSLSFYLPGVLALFLMIVMCLEICLRWIVGTSIQGNVEIVEGAMVIIAFTSLAGVQRQKGHVNMNLLLKKLPQKSRSIVETFNLVFMLVASSLIIYPLIIYVTRLFRLNETTEYLSIPLWIIGLFMPLGMFAFCVRVFTQIIAEGKNFFEHINDN